MLFNITFMVLFTINFGSVFVNSADYDVVYGWKVLDYAFPSTQERDRLIKNNEFIPENNVITGIKPSGDRLYLTVPRWREGVPATLVYVNYDLNTISPDPEMANGPPLIAYPSWEMQEVGNCSAFQYVQSMEIDQFNRMWIIDVGRVNIFTTPINNCPPKLVIIDLTSNKILKTHVFPIGIVSPLTNFLNDIVVGCTTIDDCWAYITDAGDARIVLYNLKDDKSYFVEHFPSMESDENETNITILGKEYTFDTDVDGIALSNLDSNFNRLYFCPLSSRSIYSVSTDSFQKAAMTGDNSQMTVIWMGTKASQTDGMAVDSEGIMYYGRLAQNSVVSLNVSLYNNAGSLNETMENVVVQNDRDLQWPDTFGFDGKGYLYMTTNRLQLYFTYTFDFNQVNLRVVKTFVGSKSYMFSTKTANSGATGFGENFGNSFFAFVIIKIIILFL